MMSRLNKTTAVYMWGLYIYIYILIIIIMSFLFSIIYLSKAYIYLYIYVTTYIYVYVYMILCSWTKIYITHSRLWGAAMDGRDNSTEAWGPGAPTKLENQVGQKWEKLEKDGKTTKRMGKLTIQNGKMMSFWRFKSWGLNMGPILGWWSPMTSTFFRALKPGLV